MPYVEWFYTHPWDAVMNAGEYLSLKRVSRPMAKYIVVPKTAEKGRGICSEENESQFLQQALSRSVRALIRKHPVLSKYLPLNDQSVNGKLALRASLTKKDCTLDESEASDRIIRALISYVTQDNSPVHDIIMALATDCVYVSDAIPHSRRYCQLNKFAPMGSALCFPIMTLFNYFLCKAIIRRSGATDLQARRVYVFGDDIITDTRFFNLLVTQLPKYGLKLNQTKSYSVSHFRESCGVHAYHGINITPVYIRCIPTFNGLKQNNSVLENEYRFFSKNFVFTAELLRTRLAKVGESLTPVPSTSGLRGLKRNRRDLPSDWINTLVNGTPGCRVRIDEDLQCFAYRVQTQYESGTTHFGMRDSAALLRWFSTSARDSQTVIDTHPDENREILYKWMWVPESRLTDVTVN
jgi:hypothetical protein